jgi:S-adenosylmethionine:tRNA ribosyltransferase-isomerase
MLVCAFAGYQEIKNIYKYAIDKRMRFFSYGDAMLLYKKLEER